MCHKPTYEELEKRVEELEKNALIYMRAEQALREEHSFRTAIIECAAEGLCVCHEINEHPFVRFTVWNERMTEITGYTMDEINLAGWHQCIYPDPKIQARAVELMAGMRRGKGLIAEECQLVRSDARTRTVRISASVIEGNDGLTHILALINDITDQKQAEEELVEHQNHLEKLITERTTELRKTNDLLLLETSERKRANEALKKAYQQLQDIINFLPDATFVIDQKKRVIAWNRAIEEMTGIKQEDMLGKGDYEYAAAFYGERRPMLIDLLMDGESDIEENYDFVERKDGTIYAEAYVPKAYGGRGAYLWGTSSPLFDQGGNIIGAIQSIRDISVRKQAQEAVTQSEEKYRQLFATVSDAILLFEADTNSFIDVNESATHLYGYTRDEFLAMRFTDIMAQPDQPRASGKEAARGKHTGEPLYLHRRKNGTVFPVEISSSAFVLAGRTVLCGIVRDITERKRAEEAMTQQLHFQQTLIDTIPSPIFYKDIKGIYLGCNSAFESCLGLCQDDIVGKSVYEVAPDDLAQIYREADLSLFRNPGAQQYEASFKFADGIRHDVQFIKGTFTDLDGNTAGLVGVMLDITRRKRAERELDEYRAHLEDLIKERTAELAITNQRLTDEIEERKWAEEALKDASQKLKFFAYSVAHDLKSPAVGIYGITKRLTKHARENLDDKGRTYCDQILKVSEHIAALVEKVNIYIATKETTPLIETTNVTEILRMLREEFSARLSLRRIEWRTPEHEIEIRADKLSILRVFRNLIDNALKYGGESLTRISIGHEDSDSHHIFCVSDNGRGLKESDSEKIFGLFQRNETSRGVEGAGLGLTIVKEIAEQHGGKVWLEPRGKRGITFCISISRTLPPLQKTGEKPLPC